MFKQTLIVLASCVIVGVHGFVIHTGQSKIIRSWISEIQSHQPRMVLDTSPVYNKYSTVPVPLDEESHTTILTPETGGPHKGLDPFKLVKDDIAPFSSNIKELVDTDHPVLTMAASHFFEKRHGKRFRPTVVTLMARALAPEGKYTDTNEYALCGQLGQITEMIHVASLIHDDVLDEADTRRGGDAVHKLYSNKVAVLAGDFLLARASVLLARLNDVQVVEVMAMALDYLVQGEIVQAKSPPEKLLELEHYIKKSYYKTASLIANSCKSAALLWGNDFDGEVAAAAEKYGYHMGLAFQIVDDLLDFTVSSEMLGKPAMADVSLGLATAPVLYAAEEKPELKALVKRRFKNPGDKEKALNLVMATDGIERSRDLALFHAQSAVNAVMELPPSQARDALVQVCHIVLTRKS